MYMDSYLLATMAAEACDDIKANDIQLINISEVSSIAEWIVILGIAVLGLGFGGIARLRRVKKFLGE